MNRSTERLQRSARWTVVLLLVAVNGALVLLNLQKHGVISTDLVDLESVFGLGDGDEADGADGDRAAGDGDARPDSMAFDDDASTAGADADADAGAGGAADAVSPAELGADWPGGAPAVPAEPPIGREALLADDGSVRLIGAVPSWSVATELAANAGARLPEGVDAVAIDYSWHPAATSDGRDGVARLAEPLLYEPGQAAVPADAEPGLETVGEILVANPSVYAVLVGYTDDFDGSDENAAVAFARASAVSIYLEQLGVPPGQVVIASPRPDESTVSNRTDDGRRFNRRLEIELENFLTTPVIGG